jgi:cytochrome P450
MEWKQYMDELFAMKVQEARRGESVEGMDLLGNLVRSSYSDAIPSPGRAEKGQVGSPTLSDSDILGNAFIMIVAGHETTANSIHFGLMELAMNPRPQKLLQTEIETIFGDQPPGLWDYESTINTLLGGICGAVMNEQLRLMPPVIAIPKHVTKTSDQDIILDGKKFTLPAGTHITINAVGVQRNPNAWPSQPSKISGSSDDLNDFIPERWLVKSSAEKEIDHAQEIDGEGFGGFTGHDSSAQLYRPVKGSYIPFSEGPRSCLGRRLAQVELMAAFAVIFQQYSLELAVDEWASDVEVAKMSDAEKRMLYTKAQDAARAKIRSCSTVLSLKLHPGFIPIRVVKKGEERFIGLID